MPGIPQESYNSLTKTRFILDLNLEGILGTSGKLSSFLLNCYSVRTPEVIAGVTYQAYCGYKIPIPNGNREDDKVLRISFVVSENMVQYAAMLKWINMVTSNVENSEGGESSESLVEKVSTTANLWVLDSYLKPLPTPIAYSGVFICKLGELEFDQTDQGGEIVKCTADFAYFRSEMEIDKLL